MHIILFVLLTVPKKVAHVAKTGAVAVYKAYAPDGDDFKASQKKKDHGY